jgi:hypothetical protein
MADWDKLTTILKQSSLDKETKLMIIDLLSLSNNPELEEQISELVFTWHTADTAIVNTLISAFDDVQREYSQKNKLADTRITQQTRQLADDIGKQQRIKQLRDEIETL